MPLGRPLSPLSLAGVNRRSRRRTRRRTALVVGGVAATAGYVAGKAGSGSKKEPEYNDEPAPVQVVPVQQAAAPDSTTELEKLAQLHAQGVLTDEEFAAKKKQILGI